MTETRRIYLNIIATYGRSVYALVIGLICGRWTLAALGEVDYGLVGVIGGLTIFISYFNTIIVGAIGRFYAIAVGMMRTDPKKGIEECQRWFTVAVLIQSFWPTLLLIIGYPLGIWAIHNFLTIPAERVGDCIWVWRFTCFSSYVSMVTVPLSAMYSSKQYISELTIYSFVTMTLNAFFVYYMASHPGVWLLKVSLWGSFLSVAPSLIIAIRGYYLFPECRFRLKYIRCWKSICELGKYALWNAWGILGAYLRGQGMTIVINKFFGPRVNAAMTIGNTVAGQCNALSGSLTVALRPAICNAWGSGDFEYAKRLAFRMCKVGTLLIMIFAIPLMLEAGEVLTLWLKSPPKHSAEFCVFVLCNTIIDKLTIGHLACVDSNGKIAWYQAITGTGAILALPAAIALIYCDVGVYSVWIALIGSTVFCTVARVYFARVLVKMSVRYWLTDVLAPMLCVAMVGFGFGALSRLTLSASFLRICITTALVELTVLPLIWYVVLNKDEKMFVVERMKMLLVKFPSRRSGVEAR